MDQEISPWRYWPKSSCTCYRIS